MPYLIDTAGRLVLKLVPAVAVSVALALAAVPSTFAAEQGHDSGKHDEGGGKGKGPKYKGGDKGTSHSSEAHAAGGGTGHSSSASGGASKETEEKIFDAPTSHAAGKGKGPKYKGGGKGGDTGKHDEGGDAGHDH